MGTAGTAHSNPGASNDKLFGMLPQPKKHVELPV